MASETTRSRSEDYATGTTFRVTDDDPVDPNPCLGHLRESHPPWPPRNRTVDSRNGAEGTLVVDGYDKGSRCEIDEVGNVEEAAVEKG